MAISLRSPQALGVISTIPYMLLNILMNIYMKWLFAPAPWGGDFALPWTMLTFQQLQTYVILQMVLACRDPQDWGWKMGEMRDGSSIQPSDWLRIVVLTVLFCCNVGLNSVSLVRLSITLNQTIRAFLPIGVLFLANCLERRPYPWWSYLTATILTCGIALSCLNSPGFDAQGFFFVSVSTIAAALGASLGGRMLHAGAFAQSGGEGGFTQILRLLMLQSIPAVLALTPVAWYLEGEQLQSIFAGGSGSSTSVEGSSLLSAHTWRWQEKLGLVSISGFISLAANLCRCGLVAASGAFTETMVGNAKVAALCVIDSKLFGTRLFVYNYVGVMITFAGFSVHTLLSYAAMNKEEDEDAREHEMLEKEGLEEQSAEAAEPVAARQQRWGCNQGSGEVAPPSTPETDRLRTNNFLDFSTSPARTLFPSPINTCPSLSVPASPLRMIAAPRCNSDVTHRSSRVQKKARRCNFMSLETGLAAEFWAAEISTTNSSWKHNSSLVPITSFDRCDPAFQTWHAGVEYPEEMLPNIDSLSRGVSGLSGNDEEKRGLLSPVTPRRDPT